MTGILPFDMRIVPHIPPMFITMERTADAGRFGRLRIAVTLEPAQAIPAVHALFDQRPAVHLPLPRRRFHPHCLVGRDADPDLNGPRRYPRLRPDSEHGALRPRQRL